MILVAAGLWIYSVRSENRVPHLEWPGASHAGFEINPGATPGPAVWSFGGVPMCTDIPGIVQVTSLVPQGGDGKMKVVAFAVAQTLNNLGSSRRSLAAEGFPNMAIVNTTCAAALKDKVGPGWLGVTFKGPGSFTSLRVNYTSAGEHRHMVIPWGTKICPPAKSGFC